MGRGGWDVWCQRLGWTGWITASRRRRAWTICEVPVWFPLRVRRHTLIDSLDVKPQEERRTIDNARLIAAKTDEVLRANGHRVAVIVRQGANEKLNQLVHSLLLEEGAVGDRGPELHTFAEVDRFVEGLSRPQLDLPDDVDLSEFEE
jgi:hypothetical protein